MAWLPDADQGGLPVPRFDSCGAHCIGPGAVPGPGAARGIAGHSGMAELLFQVANDCARALPGARSVHSVDEVEEHFALANGRDADYTPWAGVLRLNCRGWWEGLELLAGTLQALWCFPFSGLGRAEHSFDDRHVADGILQGIGNLAVFADGLREQVSLNRELVADGEGFGELTSRGVQVLAIINIDAGRLVRGGVEGDLNVDAAFRAKELHALVVDQLRRAGKNALPGRVFEDRRREPVGLETGVALNATHYANRFLVENKTRGFDGVAADIHQSAAGGVNHVACVFRINIEIAEKTKRRMQFSDSARPDKFASPNPLRVCAHHEGFPNFHTAPVAGFQQTPGLRDRAAKRLLT